MPSRALCTFMIFGAGKNPKHLYSALLLLLEKMLHLREAHLAAEHTELIL
jgi:hypothetical protein